VGFFFLIPCMQGFWMVGILFKYLAFNEGSVERRCIELVFSREGGSAS